MATPIENHVAGEISKIADSLQSIADSLSHSFGKFRKLDPSTWVEEAQREQRHNDADRLANEKIEELKLQNKTTVFMAWVAVVGLIVTAATGVVDIVLRLSGK